MTESILIALVGLGATFISGGMTFLLMKGKTRSEMQLNQLEAIQKTLKMHSKCMLLHATTIRQVIRLMCRH